MSIRIGVLSFAHYHANFWSDAFLRDPRAELAGVWDADAARGRAAAERYGAEFVGDLDALLDRVDAVAICSETAKHRALIEAACARGRHVLCEKPIAATLADADAIAHAVKAAGIVFMQSFPKRFDPVNHELKALVDSGAFGKLWLVRVRHGHRHGLDQEFTRGWWADPALSGGGTLIDEGVHAADFLRWLFGEPESVQAAISSAALGLAVDDTAVAVFRWADGLLGEVATGWMFQAADTSIEIYGTMGAALLSGVDIASRDVLGNGPHLRVLLEGAPERRWQVSETVPQFVRGEFHHQNAYAFVESLANGTPPPIGLADGRGALAMILAAYAAARSGGTVDIAEFSRGTS
jgi:myo-inositol 2-dehydrogenase/D-chiro-inositol 1-dehydrogenase